MTADQLALEADPALAGVWEPLWTIRAERALWVAVMRAQSRLGIDIPTWAIESSDFFARNIPSDTLQRIDDRERVTRHDLKSRLEIFCEQAGHEYHHLGMTSADVVDNMMQIRMLRSMEWLEQAHGIRLSVMDRYSFRGIKGAVGTQQDQLDLLGSVDSCRDLDRAVAEAFGFTRVMGSVGQVYPRSQDLEVVSELMAAVARRSVRPDYMALLGGFLQMCAAYSGSQWNEGDVSTSVVRRYCLPSAWFAASAALDPGLPAGQAVG